VYAAATALLPEVFILSVEYPDIFNKQICVMHYLQADILETFFSGQTYAC
jgi:hypothetical protein